MFTRLNSNQFFMQKTQFNPPPAQIMLQVLTLTYNFPYSSSKKALWQGWNKNTLSEVFFRSKLNVSGLACLHHRIHFIVPIIQNNRKLIVASFFNSDRGHGEGTADRHFGG